MGEHLNTFWFGIYPYIAIATMIIGSILRYDQDPYSWKADSSQLLSRKGLRLGSNLFHIGILFIFFGHLGGLLTPHWAYEPFISSGQKQILAMAAGGIFGALCFVGMVILIWRRAMEPRVKATTKFMDMAAQRISPGSTIPSLLNSDQPDTVWTGSQFHCAQ